MFNYRIATDKEQATSLYADNWSCQYICGEYMIMQFNSMNPLESWRAAKFADGHFEFIDNTEADRGMDAAIKLHEVLIAAGIVGDTGTTNQARPISIADVPRLEWASPEENRKADPVQIGDFAKYEDWKAMVPVNAGSSFAIRKGYYMEWPTIEYSKRYVEIVEFCNSQRSRLIAQLESEAYGEPVQKDKP